MMLKKYLKKVIAIAMVAMSLMALSPIGASAEWRQNSTGWWYEENSSYATGWRNIDGNWYYFYSNGYMAHDTTIDGYYLNSDGAWTNSEQQDTSETNSEVMQYVISDIFKNNTSMITNLHVGKPWVIDGVTYYGITYEMNTPSQSVKLLCLDYTDKKTLSYDEMDKILAPLGKSHWDLQD